MVGDWAFARACTLIAEAIEHPGEVTDAMSEAMLAATGRFDRLLVATILTLTQAAADLRDPDRFRRLRPADLEPLTDDEIDVDDLSAAREILRLCAAGSRVGQRVPDRAQAIFLGRAERDLEVLVAIARVGVLALPELHQPERVAMLRAVADS